MAEYLKKNVQLHVLTLCVLLPLVICLNGEYPQRGLLKDTLSLITVLSFSLMIGLFYLVRFNKMMIQRIGFASILTWHKRVGYVVAPLLLVHPFLLVVPRFFEAGVAPEEAFQTIITTFSSSGVVLGLCAWGGLLLLLVMALLRKRLPVSYRFWRISHGILALSCAFCAVLHVVDLGRHADRLLIALIVLASSAAFGLILKNYLFSMGAGLHK